jgi:hypothetical protein
LIKTFRSRGTELLFARKSVALFQAIELAQGIELIVRGKLAQLNAAAELRDLTVPPENCLEPVTLDTTSRRRLPNPRIDGFRSGSRDDHFCMP